MAPDQDPKIKTPPLTRRLEVLRFFFWADVATPRRGREGGHGIGAVVEIQDQMKTTTFQSNNPKWSVRKMAETCRDG